MNIKWEVRIAGPDDVLTFSSETEAYKYAKAINAVSEYCNDQLHEYDRVLCEATVHRVDAEA